jgi:hypothetical protein
MFIFRRIPKLLLTSFHYSFRKPKQNSKIEAIRSFVLKSDVHQHLFQIQIEHHHPIWPNFSCATHFQPVICVCSKNMNQKKPYTVLQSYCCIGHMRLAKTWQFFIWSNSLLLLCVSNASWERIGYRCHDDGAILRSNPIKKHIDRQDENYMKVYTSVGLFLLFEMRHFVQIPDSGRQHQFLYKIIVLENWYPKRKTTNIKCAPTRTACGWRPQKGLLMQNT